MESIAGFLSTSSDSDSDEQNVRACRKVLRDKSNPLSLPNGLFIKLFRVSKDAFTFLLKEMESNISSRSRSSSISHIHKLSAFLRFVAEGSYQKSAGQDFCVAMCQTSVSRTIFEMLTFFEEKICDNFISFHQTNDEKTKSKQWFYQKHNFPGVIGCVDGTHIDIVTPSHNEHIFFNRKGRHSINAMIACDFNMKIIAVDARFGGSSHDSYVWQHSDLKKYLMEKNETNSWLLGDSGYPLEPWLITPYRNALEGSQQAHFNAVHSKCRNIVERTFGVLKNRFRCLLGARQLHYSPIKAAQILNACCALHNICLKFNVQFEDDFLLETEDMNDPTVNTQHTTSVASTIRDRIMNSFF